MFPFLPSYWLSSAVLQSAEGVMQRRRFFRAGAVEQHAVFWRHRLHEIRRPVLQHGLGGAKPRGRRVQTEFSRRARTPVRPIGLLEKIAAKCSWFDRATRALAVKDVRMFWRDTTQWGQSVMLFGLLGAYIVSVRNFTHQLTSPFWINARRLWNLAACSLNLATVTTRFVFPQFSLEGQRLWIVGMSPMGLERVIKTKFWLSSLLSLVVTLGLVTLSCYLLKMPWERRRVFWRGHHRDDLRAQRPRRRPRRAVSEPEGGQPRQDRQRLWRHALPGVEFLYIVASVAMLGLRHGGFHGRASWAVGKRHRLCGALVFHRLAAAEMGLAAAEKF